MTKTFVFFAFAIFIACSTAVFVPPRPGHKHAVLGSNVCTRGPAYWCQNLTSASGCHAVKHCIQTVWEHQQLPADPSNICEICLDMVKQARDQLESNETQELIKEVFEGSCALLYVKPVVKICDEIADNYIPDLIDTLASQMNPQVVCAVAGLCNNDKVHKLIAEYQGAIPLKQPKVNTCDQCHTVVDLIRKRFDGMSRDEVLQSFLEVCRDTGSLSDACSNIVLTYFTEIYTHIKDNFNSKDVCLLSGECSANFHTHAKNIEITPISHIGYIPVNQPKDSMPCEFCEQLVEHYRDVLVANTTEIEFKKILEGVCKQTRSFKTECLNLVDEYYEAAYSFLINELNSTVLCTMLGICPKSSSMKVYPIMPLLPVETADALEIRPVPTKKPLVHVKLTKDASSVRILQNPEKYQLPIELLMPPHTQLIFNQETCAFCQYFLHYVQQAITNPTTQAEIKDVLDKACSILPSSVNNTCIEFVATYEPALVAILAQEIDPSQICPLIKVCPGDVKDIDIFMHHPEGDNSKCPLCLFAVTRLEEMVKDKKTEEEIKQALDELCSKLSKDLAPECKAFVEKYTEQLVELIIADATPNEVCVFLKLCTDKSPALPSFVASPVYKFAGDIETNAILDNTINGEEVNSLDDPMDKGPECVLCEFVMKEIDDQLKDKTTDDEIKKVVHSVCDVMPGTIKDQCNSFVNQYADMIILLLQQALEPSEICGVMKLCNANIQAVQVEIFDCAICESIVYVMEKILANPRVDHDIKHVLEKTCRALPDKDRAKCQEIIEEYGTTIFNLIEHFANKQMICREIGLCAAEATRPVITHSDCTNCSCGKKFWCRNTTNARGCNAMSYCQDNVWKSKTPKAAGLI